MNLLLWAGVVLIGGAGSVARFLADGVVASAQPPLSYATASLAATMGHRCCLPALGWEHNCHRSPASRRR
jgi:hypothetical protein